VVAIKSEFAEVGSFYILFFRSYYVCSGEIEDGGFPTFCCIAFFIWDKRNWVVHEKGTHNPIAVVERARNLHHGYHSVSNL
jgi:hypothetical protein